MNPLALEILPLVRQGYCCSQVLMLLLMQKIGRENPELIRAVHGLCHGMGDSEGPCGLLTGGACMLSYIAGRGKNHESAHPSFVPLVADFQRWFAKRTEKYGGTVCFQIMQGLSAETGVPSPVAGAQPEPCLCGGLFVECWEKIHALFEEYQIPLTRWICCQPVMTTENCNPEMLIHTPDKDIASEHIRETVRAGYAAIAIGQQASCSSQLCGHADPAKLAQAVGYDAASLARLPDGANMGLSCGNPVAIAALQEGQMVLDLGSGGGFDVFQAGEKVKASGRVIGVDMTPEMLTKARENIEQYRQRTGLDNVEFRLGEIEYLPVPDSSVDVVLSNCVINLSPDKSQVWRDIFRVLKIGGKVSVSDLALLKPLPDNIREMAAALVGCVVGAALMEETRCMLEKVGFTSITLTPKPDYIRSMLEWNDPLYKAITEAMPKGEEMADYVVSLDIEAKK